MAMTTSCESRVPATLLPAKGERFKCEQCGMQIEIITPCNCDQGHPQFICCGQPLTPCGQTLLVETKEAFLEQMQAGMDKTKQSIAWLKEKADQAKDATKDELTREAEALSDQYEKLRDSLDEVKSSSRDAWWDVATGCSEAWQRFKAACQQSVSRYR